MALAQLSLCWDAAADSGARAAQRALELGVGVDGGTSTRHAPIATNLVLQRKRVARPQSGQGATQRVLPRDSLVGGAAELERAPAPVHERVEALEALRAATDHYADAAAAERTRRARTQDWAAFAAWCEAHALCALPAEVDTLRLYLASLAKRGLRASTIRRARCSIGLHHECHAQPRPDGTWCMDMDMDHRDIAAIVRPATAEHCQCMHTRLCSVYASDHDQPR